jgi:hypothetical protein
MCCPVCVIKDKKEMNSQKTYQLRSSFDMATKIDQYRQKTSLTQRLKFSDDLKLKTGFMPVKCAFSDFCLNPYAAYVPDLLHQPKKGVFADLLEALRKYLIHHNWLEMVEERMKVVPRFQSVEKFGRSYFKMQTITASNYNDMVRTQHFGEEFMRELSSNIKCKNG